jgi:stage V sporulation protein SpoVS
MKCRTKTAVEVAGVSYPPGAEIAVTQDVYEKLLARGAVEPFEIDFKAQPPAAEIHIEAQAPLATKVEQTKRFILGRKKR